MKGGGPHRRNGKQRGWGKVIGLLIALAGTVLIPLAIAYYTLIQQRYKLDMIHPASYLKLERDKEKMILSISGGMENFKSPGITFENDGNRPITIINLSYIFDLNADTAPSCRHGRRFFLGDEKFKATVIKPSEAVTFDNVFTTETTVNDWNKLFVHDPVFGLACISVQILDTGQGPQDIIRIFGNLQMKKSSMEMFKYVTGRYGGTLIPIEIIPEMHLVDYIRWY